MDNWGVDVVISASQKGLGAPPDLGIVIASHKAMKVEVCLSVCQSWRALTDCLGLQDRLKACHRIPYQLEEASLYMTQLRCYVHCYHRWLSIMKAYEGGSAAHFATTSHCLR